MCFFTMELVEGVDFVTHVRRGRDAHEPPGNEASSAPDAASGTEGMDEEAIAPGGYGRTAKGRSKRLRAALAQLAQGLSALHAAGKVHRDIKPSNVLVRRDGHLVIVDFGMVIEQDRDGLDTEEGLAGTVAYMSPEQAAGQPVAAASDWYSVGVMLYEALTGERPFTGNAVTILADKQRRDPPRPVERNPAVEADLDELCMSLLSRAPKLRPGADAVLAQLATVPPGSPSTGPPSPPTTWAGEVFVGRRNELAHLARTWQHVCSTGSPALVLVSGPSGIGKTVLVERFLAELAAGRDGSVPRGKPPVVLRGRCREREAVAYKAFDQVVDDITRLLMKPAAGELLGRVAGEAAHLAAVFPVVRRVAALGDSGLDTTLVPDPQQRRRRAFQAFRAVVREVGRVWPVVMCLDDLQWADRDSLELLELLARSPNLGPTLLLGASRDDNRETFGALARMVGAEIDVAHEPGGGQRRSGGRDEERRLVVGPLSSAEAAELAGRLVDQLGAGHVGREGLNDVASHAEGNPFYIGELVRLLRLDRDAPGGTELPSSRATGAARRLDELIDRRVQHLTPAARRVLELVCVGGEAISETVVQHAAGLDHGAFEATITELRSDLLVRGLSPREMDRVEPYHDRIREKVRDSLGSETVRDHHRRLAQAVESVVGDDVDLLARHWAAAGDTQRARGYLWRAARAADAKLAFDRAAWLYRSALEMADNEATRAKVGRALGDALANAGRPGEAAEAYLGVLPFVGKLDRLALRQAAARQWLSGGYVEKGLQAIREVAREAGVAYPSSQGQAVRSILTHRALLRLRGMGFKERAPAQIDPRTRLALDILYTICEGLMNVEPIVGADFQNRFLLAALRRGDARQVARGLALDAVSRAVTSPSMAVQAHELARRAELLARRTGDSKTIAANQSIRAGMCWYSGNWSEGIRLSLEADTMLTSRCVGVHYEIATTRWFLCMLLLRKGELKELSERTGRYVAEFQRLGNRYAVTTFKACFNLVWLARDDPGAARAELAGLLETWPPGLYTVQHYLVATARAHQRLYEGATEAAFRLLAAERPKLKRTRLLGVSGLSADYHRHLGTAALAAAASADRAWTKHRYRTEAKRAARRLLELGVPYAAAWGRLIETAAQWQSNQGSEGERRRRLVDAIAQLEVAECWAIAHAARRAEGEVLGGRDGRALIRAEDKWFRSQGVCDPARFARVLAPGFVG